MVATNLSDSLIQHITSLFNASLATGHFPALFKLSHTILIHKQGKDKQLPGSYRPTALLEILGKTLEKIINTRLLEHLITMNILPPFQYGFRKHKNVKTLSLLIHDIYKHTLSKRQLNNKGLHGSY